MKRVRQSNTPGELAVRAILREQRVRANYNVKNLPGRPDVAIRSKRKAIFIHGCFWHGHKKCGRGRIPKRNRAFWDVKLRTNVARDQRKIAALEQIGYDVLVLWECEIEHGAGLAARISAFLKKRAISKVDACAPPDLQYKPETFVFDEENSEIVRLIRRRNGSTTRTQLPLLEPIFAGDAGSAFDGSWLKASASPAPTTSVNPLKIVDLFSGCGGMSLGIIEAARALGMPHEVVLAADIDTVALGIYQRNLAPTTIESRPIETWLDGKIGAKLTRSEIRLRRKIGRVDILVGGPPCQGHSNLNNFTRREDPKNTLFERMARCAEVLKPIHVIVENVSGVLHDRNGVFQRTHAHLENLGYYVDYGFLQADDFGLAQRRRRVFLIASKRIEPSIARISRDFARNSQTFDWACADLMTCRDTNDFNTPSIPKKITRKRIDILFDKNLYDLPDAYRPDCHRLKEHTYNAVYGRLMGFEPAPTITTGFLVMGQGRFVHPYERRTLTPHEGARLQFFPDWFDFGSLSRSDFAQVIGNAVPPKLSYVVAADLLR